jgi:hypothetical protein
LLEDRSLTDSGEYVNQVDDENTVLRERCRNFDLVRLRLPQSR